METGRASTPFLATVATVLLLSCLQCRALQISPSDPEVVLSPGSTLALTCSGRSAVSWRVGRLDSVPAFSTEKRGASTVLILEEVMWRHTGVYVCTEEETQQSREVAVFVPDPDVWFVEREHNIVTTTSEVDTIPCVVTDPRIKVTLHEYPSDTLVKGLHIPSKGFTAALEDRSYVCHGHLHGDEKESQAFYIYSIIVPEELKVYVNASKTVLKQGETLSVNCTVHEVDLINVTWTLPYRNSSEILTDVVSATMRSRLTIPQVTLRHTGRYVCNVHETVANQHDSASVDITVLERGFVELRAGADTHVWAQLHENIVLRVEIEAYPKPRVTWTKDNGSLSVDHHLSTSQEQETRYISTLTLVRVRAKQKGRYTVLVTNEDATQELTFALEVKVPPLITELMDHPLPEKRHMAVCVADGVPPPSIQWYWCDSVLKCSNATVAWQPLDPEHASIQTNVSYNESRSVAQVRSQVTFDSLQQVTLRCEAHSEAGVHTRNVKLVSNTLFYQVAVLATVLALVVIAVIFMVFLIALWRKKPRYEIRWKVIESVSLDGHEYIYVDPIHLPYDLAWELPRDSLVLGRTLGSGAFGRVVEATAYGLGHSQSSMKVAVKMLKSTARRSETQALMSELKIMSHLGPHLNIVNLLGACTKQGPLYLVTEYCRYGDLVDYLHRNKNTYLQYYADKSRRDVDTCGDGDSERTGKGYVSLGSKGDGGYMDMSKDDIMDYMPMLELSDSIKYAEIQPSPYESQYQQDLYQNPGLQEADMALVISDSPILTHTDLMGFSYQVAMGMEFLASKNCVHRDLAARNVLICEGKLVKICDFGLARDIMHDSNYISKGSTFLPLKWMAPESIFHNLYTTLSDVWSYGILLWEIFTLGGTPYPDLPMNELFYNALKRGYRLNKPPHATDNIYEVMRKCWNEKYEERPQFPVLVQTMGNMLADGYKKRYSQVNDAFFQSNHPAVARTKPRLPLLASSPAPFPDPHREEVTSSFNNYIIPIPDPKPEDDILEESPLSSLAADEDTTETVSLETGMTLSQDGKSSHDREEKVPMETSGTPDVEESFL